MTTAPDQVNGTPLVSPAESWARASIAEAEADVIRSRAEAEIEVQKMQAQASADAARIKAEAEAEAVRIKAREEAERQRLANERAALRAERERAEQNVKIAEAKRKAAEAERLAAAEERAAQEAQAAEEASDEARAKTAKSWRTAAISFAILCALVALPVQMSAFYSPERPYLGGVPIVLELGAWVVLKGAAAAVTDRRPHWHYRLIAWCIAAGAASVNLAHGLTQFDLTTAVATAVASIAGPGIWDLHEHGRIRLRDGKVTWWAARRAEAKKAEAERQARAQKAATEKAAAEAEAKLATERQAAYPNEWKHALRLAAALGETAVTEGIWKRAYRDINGVDPGDSVEIIRGRNAAERRLIAARSEAPGNRPVKAANAQHASQMPPSSGTRLYRPPARAGVRRKGDTQKYVAAARTQAAITAKNATIREGENA
jgi:chemotaxis protein histidine kinase CheA